MSNADVLKQKIRESLTRAAGSDLQGQGKPSAVLLPLFLKGGECYLLLTRRTQKVEYHKGEISFPGGAREEGDRDLLDTALRETQEETGIEAATVEILGKLDDTLTVGSNFVITPFVGWIPYPCKREINHLEIEELLEIPLGFFLSRQNYWKGNFRYHQKSYESHFYLWREDAVVWGATARIIHHFCRLLEEAGFNPVVERMPSGTQQAYTL